VIRSASIVHRSDTASSSSGAKGLMRPRCSVLGARAGGGQALALESDRDLSGERGQPAQYLGQHVEVALPALGQRQVGAERGDDSLDGRRGPLPGEAATGEPSAGTRSASARSSAAGPGARLVTGPPGRTAARTRGRRHRPLG
jgi:hypothetical protein